MLITIELKCPHCHSPKITRNGKKYKGKHRILIRNYRCSHCGRQFSGDYQMTYRGCLSGIPGRSGSCKV